MQINSPANLKRTGLTVESAFDPCASIRAGAQILLDDYQDGATTREKQIAVLRALSAYDTGSTTAGLTTYVPSVLASARKVIPDLATLGLAPETGAKPPQIHERTSPDVAPAHVFTHPAAGTRELVFSAN
jgi:type IV secretion system protein VirB1